MMETKTPLTIDTATGLPALKPGHFWRVRLEDMHYWSRLKVEVWKQAPRWYNKNRVERVKWGVAVDWDTYEKDTDKKALIRRLAEKVIHDSFNADEANDLLGDYPPKNLNGE